MVDLCHRLVHAGHRVDLFANSWKAEALPPEVGLVRVKAEGWTRWQRTWNFARNSERALREAGLGLRLHGRADQHLASRRHHPARGRPRREPRGQREAVPAWLATLGLPPGQARRTPRPGSTGRSSPVSTTRPEGRASSRSPGWSGATWSGITASHASASTSSPTRSTPAGSRSTNPAAARHDFRRQDRPEAG